MATVPRALLELGLLSRLRWRGRVAHVARSVRATGPSLLDERERTPESRRRRGCGWASEAPVKSEIVFRDWDTTDDLDALRKTFDTNNNGQLDAGDARARLRVGNRSATRQSSFRIVVTNADGTTTVKTLAEFETGLIGPLPMQRVAQC